VQHTMLMTGDVMPWDHGELLGLSSRRDFLRRLAMGHMSALWQSIAAKMPRKRVATIPIALFRSRRQQSGSSTTYPSAVALVRAHRHPIALEADGSAILGQLFLALGERHPMGATDATTSLQFATA
jgi:hypothetical protein